MDKIKISGKIFYREDFMGAEMPLYFKSSGFLEQIYTFLNEWFSLDNRIKLFTSGSTGKPKEIIVDKQKMIESAAMTCEYFKLKENDRALLCLSTEYIAGKMMLVRAIYCGMDIYPVTPNGNPLREVSSSFDFAAMVPLQVYNSLNSEKERIRLSQISNIIIGGGAIDKDLEEDLKLLPNSLFSTYGMTETLSHIAIRKINGEGASDFYTPLSGVKLKLSDNSTLIIDAPKISDAPIVTNDIVELRDDATFRVIGRVDNIINTGGIKVQAEEVEDTLQPYLKGNYAISSVPHTKLGEAVVLIVDNIDDKYQAEEYVNKILPRYQQPLYIINVESIPMTGNGKIDRKSLKKLAELNIEL